MTDWKQWQANMAKWDAAVQVLLTKNKRIHALAAERANKDYRFDLMKFFDRLRIRFDRELERIPTP